MNGLEAFLTKLKDLFVPESNQEMLAKTMKPGQWYNENGQWKQMPGGTIAPLPQTQTQPTTTPTPATPQPTATPMPIPNVTPDPNAQLPGGPGWLNTVSRALQIANQYGIPASVLTGQMALESGRGQSQFAQGRNNFFGYQAYDANPDQATTFKSPADSIVAYAKTLAEDPRYQQAMRDRSDPEQMLKDIKAAGYASDPNYVAKIMSTPEYRKYLPQKK